MFFLFLSVLLFRYLFLSKHLSIRGLFAFDSIMFVSMAGAMIGAQFYVIGVCAALMSLLAFLAFAKASKENKQ